ncbi:LysM peptidoglycan-binding domain-containing protein [Paenibacillus sp. GD4]|uniref:CIS tube protein n=1 Tax=Paenibacillus sp. GD4 TaxID=3068890 RepID=UPI002796AA56|nr:LysM peptidoglycan-binding domain-containing protein [Paenibacillus sp. GD4]MDQ1909560.1 LysM peptidoglycan-binding domain-containing protein [Paenibacillus sp. GD4]
MALTKAKIFVEATNPYDFEVLFNPSEYELETTNSFAFQESPGASAPTAQFLSGDETVLTMDLFFDTYEASKDVREETFKIVKLLEVDSDLHAPPYVRFVWGSLNFRGVVEKVKQKYTMFLDSGIPVRATLSVTIKAVMTLTEQLQLTPRQSADRTKQKPFNQGDQLWMMAAHEYDDPGKWRDIARANRIDNPRHIEPGRKLIVPRLE